jgi:hypothetical protein
MNFSVLVHFTHLGKSVLSYGNGAWFISYEYTLMDTNKIIGSSWVCGIAPPQIHDDLKYIRVRQCSFVAKFKFFRMNSWLNLESSQKRLDNTLGDDVILYRYISNSGGGNI